MVRVGPFRNLTQGTIFSCARAEAYSSRQVCGLIITARCDTAHDKASIINYAPVVRFEDWLCVDAVRILGRRNAADALGSMKAALKDGGMTPDILETQSPSEILAELRKSPDKAVAKAADRFENSHKLALAATNAIENDLTQAKAIEFLDGSSKAYSSLVRELLSHSLADFHYLESVEPDEDADGYVILLREIRFLPLNVVKRLEGGMDQEEFESFAGCPAGESEIQLSFDGSDPYAMPLSTVQSPDIELIMQRLTQLFARVGVKDVERTRVSRLQGSLARMKET